MLSCMVLFCDYILRHFTEDCIVITARYLVFLRDNHDCSIRVSDCSIQVSQSFTIVKKPSDPSLLPIFTVDNSLYNEMPNQDTCK